MNAKSKKIYGIGTIIFLLIVWIYYGVYIYPLFSEVKDLTTPDTSYMIRLLEFTNYRGEKLVAAFIEFFILISISNIISLYLYKTIDNKSSKKVCIFYFLGIASIIIIISTISNVFWTVYVLLASLSFLIVSASNYVASLIWGNRIVYEKDDVVFSSDKSYKSKELAEKEMSKKLSNYNLTKLSGEVFMVEDEYYFEIYANDKIVLDSRGENVNHEEI